eukprot:156505_1
MQSLNHLIWGYIRTSRGAFIPNDIKLLIEQYMQYREYEGIFELQNTGKSCKVITPKELTTSSNQSARLSLALPRYKQYPFIKTWKVKFIARRDAKYKRELKNSYFMIGVVSQKCKRFDHTAYDGLIDAFGVSGWPKMVFNGNGTHQRDESMTAKLCFHDVVEIEYDSTECKLSFTNTTINHTIWEIQLPQNNTWFPAVSFDATCICCEIV